MPKGIFCPAGSHTAIKYAVRKLAERGFGDTAVDSRSAGVVVGTGASLQLLQIEERSFRIFRKEGQVWFVGDRPRSVLAGVLYYLHHLARGQPVRLPFERTSPFRQRLIVEDFPFHCYHSTGFEIDSLRYVENLVALGYTAMECNRFSRAEPMKPYFDSYLFTNPSPAPFVWTEWHEQVWDPEIVEANARELRSCIDMAVSFDLEPSVTTFLPRPYPEAFFLRHPHLRGPSFRHEGLIKGNHPAVFRIDTDHPEGLAFYREVYRRYLGRFPEISHFFFWHADQGAGFWPDDGGATKRRTAQRIGEFHAMFEEVLDESGSDARVWINPWCMAEQDLDELNVSLPRRVGFAVKDNTRVPHFLGTTLSELPDLTIINAQVGELARKIKGLATTSSRAVCLSQYQDFSEDLDPVLGVPHPLLTFRKFRSLCAYGTEFSSTNWGVLSPDAGGSRINQDVIRECTWGADAACFEDIAALLFPASLGEEKSAVAKAWRKIDTALLLWPQFWGLRFQDGGMRFRWLIKPLALPGQSPSHSEKQRLLESQIYHIDSETPFTDYLNLSLSQAREVAAIYSQMVDLLLEAEVLLNSASKPCPEWISSQMESLVWMRLFFTTYRNLFSFHALPQRETYTSEHHFWRQAEVENVQEILRHLDRHRHALIIAGRGKWGQCFGSDIEDDFRRKLAWMLDISEKPLHGGTERWPELSSAAPTDAGI